MELKPLYAPSLKELFISQMQDQILSGELPINTKLPPERELGEKLHVSRAVVNAGIGELARRGFLEVRPRQGTYVADYRRNGNLDTLTAIMQYNGGTLGKEEIRSILEVRWGLEQMAVARAIDFASDEELEKLGEAVEELGTLPPPTLAWAAEIAFRFHHGMTLAGGNTILPLIYSSFQEPCMALWIRFCRKYGVGELRMNMQELHRRMLNRDKAGALQWINDYLGQAVSGNRQIYDEA